MNTKSIKKLSIALLLSLAAAFGLAACNSSESTSSSSIEGLTGGIAATVNGQEIPEDDVTTYIQSYRSYNGLDDDDAWGNYLVSVGEDVKQFREDFIDYFISQKLTAQACEERGIEVTDEEIDKEIEQMRSYYSSDEAWQTALEQAGLTEESYRDSLRTSMLDEKLQEEIGKEAEPVSETERLETAQMYASFIDGSRRSSHILFNLEDKETAEKVLAMINNNEISFEDAAKEYSEDTSGAEGGDVGWDKINSFVEEYANALSELEVGQVSGLVESQYGYHIIKCTDLFTVPEGGITSADQLPEALLEVIDEQLQSSAKTTAVNDWYKEYKEAADIVINDMPEGLPYDIDLAPYEAAAEAAASSEEVVDDDSLIVDVEDEDAASDEETSSSDAVSDEETASSEAADATSGQPAEISSEAQPER
ncbi:MAG: SurA N-terminal domain-containing protein [Eggerthellaceae bacterium]|nr:SurA N-terminal domain-containing protein [Eggerthellaceae bacterium]